MRSERTAGRFGRAARVVCAAALMTGFAAGVTGCAKHYRITDTNTGQTYYTKKYNMRGGSVHFEAAQSGNSVNLQNTEIETISKKSYKEATSK